MRCFPRLVVLKKDGTTGSIYPFPTGRCSVGGLSTCDIRIPSVGKSHILVVVDKNNQAHIVNVDGSTVELNGIPVENEAFVNHKDLLKIGAKSFRFEWFSKQKKGSSNAAEVPTDDDEPEGAMRESSALENGAGGHLRTDQESHGTPEFNGTREPHGTPAASTSSASFLDQSVYKTPHIPPEEFVSPLTTSGSNDTSRQSQGASTSKGSLKRGLVKGSGQSTNPVKRLSWSDTPHRSDQEPSNNQIKGRHPNLSLSVTPSQGPHAEDDVQAGLSNGRPSDSVPSTTSTPLIDEPRIRALRLRSSLANVESTPSVASTSVRSDTDASMLDASSSSHGGAKEQHVFHTSPMKKSVRGRPSVSRNSYSSSGQDSFDQVQNGATPGTSKGVFAASTPVVPPPLGAGHVSNGVKTRSLSHQTKSNTTISEGPDSSQSFFDTSTGSYGVLSFSDGHSSSETHFQTPRANVPRKSSNVSSGSIGHRLLRKTPKQSLGSGSMNEVDPNEELPPDASGSSGEAKVASQNHAQNGQAMESNVPGSLEHNSVRTPRVQPKRKETGLSMKSSPDSDGQAQKGSRASRTPSAKARGVETPAKKGHEEGESFEHKNMSPKANHSSRAGSSKKSLGGLEELGNPSSSRISHAHALTESNGSKEATHQEMAQKSCRSTRSGSLPGPSAAVEKGDSSHQEVDSPAKTPTADRVPTPEDFSLSPVVALQKLVIPARTTRASCTPLSAKANKDAVAKGDRNSLTGAAAAKKTGTSNGLDVASGVDHSESSMELLHNVDDSVTSKKNTRASSGHASASVKEAKATEPEVAQKSFRGRSSSTKALKMHDEAEAEETDIVNRSRKSAAGARVSNRPEEDEAQEQETTTALEKPSSSAVTRSSRGSRTPASANDGTQEKAVKNARESLAGHRAASEHALEDGDNSEQNDSVSLPATTPKAKRQQSFGERAGSPVVARSSRGSRASASGEDKAEAAEKDTGKKTRGSSVGARASNRPEKGEAQEQETTSAVEPSSLVVARSSRGSRTPASANDGTLKKAVKNSRESLAGRRATSEHALEDGDNSEQNDSVSLPATTPKAAGSTVVARSSRGSRASTSGEDKAEAAEKDAGKKSRGASLGARASNRPEEGEAQEQETTTAVEPSSSVVARSSRGSRTPASANDRTREKAVTNARESLAGRRAASEHAIKDGDNSEQNDSVSLPAITPKAKRQQSFGEPAGSTVVARSSRGSQTPASDNQDTVVERSRASTAGPSARRKSRPEDEAQESITTVPVKTPKAVPSSVAELVTPSRGTRANHTPASTRESRQTLQQELSPRGSRRSQVGHTDALNVTEENESSEGVNTSEKTPKAGNQQIKNEMNGAASSTKRVSEDSHLNVTGSSMAESPKAVPKNRGSRSANTPASKGTLGENETSQHDSVDVTAKTPKNKWEKDSRIGTAQSPRTEQSTRVSRRISASVNMSEDSDLQNTGSTSQSFKSEQPASGSRASRGSGSKKEIEKQVLHSDASTAQSPKTEQESSKGSPVKAGTSKGGRTPILNKRSGENIALAQETGYLHEKSGATPTSYDVQGEKSQIPVPSPRATRNTSTPVLKRASQESGTPHSQKKEACIVGKHPCSSSQVGKHEQASNQEPQQGDANTEQPADSVSKRRHSKPERSADTDPGHLGNAEGTETETSAKKSQNVVATVSFAKELATPEAAQSRAKRATASKKQTATPDKRQQDEAAAALEMPTSRKTRGKRALASQPEASENQQDTEENTAGVPAKKKRGGRTAAASSDLKVDQEGSSVGTTKVAETAAPGSEFKAEEGPSGTPAKKRRGRPAAAISTSGDQGGTVEDLPIGKTRGKRAAAPESELKTEESTVGVPERKKRGGRAAASAGPKADQSDVAESSSSGQTKTAQASGSELNSEDATDVPAKRKRGGRIAAATSGPKADQDHVAEGKTTKASGTKLNAAEETADVPAKRKRAGRAAASASVPEADQADMAGGSSMGKTVQALGSELNPAEDTADLPAKRKRGGRVAASASGPKVDQTAQASGNELNSAQDTADVPAKRKRGGRVAASTSGPKVDDQDGVAEGSSTSKTKALQEAVAGTSHGAEARSSSRATRTASARQKKTAKAEAEPVPGEHLGGQAATTGADGEEAATLGRGRRRGAAAAGVESLPATASTPKKTRGRRPKPLDTIADEEETAEPAAGTSAAATEPRASKRATRRKV